MVLQKESTMTEEKKHGPEMTRLLDRLYGDPDPDKRAKHFSLTPGPRFHEMTEEQIAKTLNDAFDDIENGTAREVDLDD